MVVSKVTSVLGDRAPRAALVVLVPVDGILALLGRRVRASAAVEMAGVALTNAAVGLVVIDAPARVHASRPEPAQHDRVGLGWLDVRRPDLPARRRIGISGV